MDTAPSRGKEPLLVGYMSFLRVERGLQPLSIEAYGADLGQFAELLAHRGRGLAEAGRNDVGAFLAVLGSRGISPRAAARKLSSLRGFYRWLLRSSLVADDPTVHISSPSGWKVLPKAMAESRVVEMLAAAQLRIESAVQNRSAGAGKAGALEALGPALAVRDAAILELLYAGGLRASEVVTLTVASLHLESVQLHVIGKRDKERIVPIGRAAVLSLARYLREGRAVLAASAPLETRLFLTPKGRPLTRQCIWQLVKQATGGAGSPHTLRHSCATHMVDHRADLRTVQTVLGHADIATTEVYTHVALGRLRAVHRAFHPREQRFHAQADSRNPSE